MQNFTTENTPGAPRIEFPCRYPVKVMGVAHAHFHIEVLEVFRQHASGIADEHVSTRPSAKGNFVALTIEIEATGTEQLTNLFADLKKLEAVKLVL